MAEETPKPRLAVRLLAGAVFLLILFLLAAAAELAGYLYLKTAGLETYRFFVKRGVVKDAPGLFDTRDSFSYLDPHLSHTQNPECLTREGYSHTAGFVIHGDALNPDALTIVALGGSTTDPLGGKSWPEFLYERLNADGQSVRVFNGGVAGYSSNQELLKLIRDVLPLGPDLIISLNGVNDMGYMHSTTNHPMVHPYQKKVFSAITGSAQPTAPILPNAVSALLLLFQRPPAVGLNLGTIVKRKDFDQWADNVRMMHAVSSEFGVPYLCFLQPVLGVGDYTPSTEEQAMLEETVQKTAPYRDYAGDMRAFYAGARGIAKGLPCTVDLTDAFANDQGMYRDARHQTPAGRARLAEIIYTICRQRDLFKPGPMTQEAAILLTEP